MGDAQLLWPPDMDLSGLHANPSGSSLPLLTGWVSQLLTRCMACRAASLVRVLWPREANERARLVKDDKVSFRRRGRRCC